MAPPDFLATPEDLAVLVRKSAADPKVRLALRRASERFQGAVGHRVILVEDDVLVRLGSGTDTLFLKAAPVSAVSVTIGGETVPPENYTLDPEAGVLYGITGYWPYRTPITVTYTHGYAVVPGDIEDAVLEHATTICLAMAHVQQETAGTNNASYMVAATVGTTQKWADTVRKYDLTGRA